MDIRGLPNQQWKYVIVDMEDGSCVGTDNEDAAKEFARNDQCFVLAMASCQVIVVDDEGEEFSAENIPEQQLYNL